MFKSIKKAFELKEIRMKLLFTLVCIVIVRLGAHIPVPAISHQLFQYWLETSQLNLGFLDTFTGGSFSQQSIFSLSVSPYISASIIMQLLTIAIPKLEEMQKDGEDGRQKINEISRYVTIVLALIEGSAMAYGFGNSGYFVSGRLTLREFLLVDAAFLAGACFTMWLGERITAKGIGNGISIILLINIVSRLPEEIMNLIEQFILGAGNVIKGALAAVIILVCIVGMVILVILLQDAERRISVQYAKKVQGRKMIGGQSSYIPMKVNTAGVIPVIFASSFMQVPIIVCGMFGVSGSRTNFWNKVLYMLNQQNWFDVSEWGEFKYTLGAVIYVALIIFFAYFYTSVTFNPIEIANNLKKNGGFVPGIRPGKPTFEYLQKVLNKIIMIGAVALAIVSLIPIILVGVTNANVSFAATSIIIVVGVILETMQQIESQMLIRHYKGFLNE